MDPNYVGNVVIARNNIVGSIVDNMVSSVRPSGRTDGRTLGQHQAKSIHEPGFIPPVGKCQNGILKTLAGCVGKTASAEIK